jgi:hypothetical protein
MANQIQGRRTIRQNVPRVGGNPMAPVDGRENRNIRLWDLGDGKPGSTTEKLRQVYHGALNSVDRIEAHKAEVQKSGKFTATGITDDVTRFVLGEAAPTFRRGRNAIHAAKREAKELRDKIKLQPPNPGDFVGALRRREMREFLKAMPPKERNAYVSKNRDNMDADMALAIVETIPYPCALANLCESLACWPSDLS